MTSCDLGLVCTLMLIIPLILLLGNLGGHFFVKGISSIRRNAFAAIFLLGYSLGMSLLPAIIVSASHLHIDPRLFFHHHSPSETLIQLGIIKFDIGVLFFGIMVAFVFVGSLQINQLTMWKTYSKLETISRPDLAREIKERYNLLNFGEVEFLVIENPNIEAYTFTLLRKKIFFMPFRSRDVLIITTGLMELLTMEELETAIAHECAHIRSLDTVFLPFLRTISSLLFFDPILRLVRSKIVCSREFLADKTAAYETGRPLDLARSLLKMFDLICGNSQQTQGVPLFQGQRKPLLIRRIIRLIELSERIGVDNCS
ncbi:MAG: M56 family metallopeptidase [Candidatus Heimdallarchaeota archaeon]